MCGVLFSSCADNDNPSDPTDEMDANAFYTVECTTLSSQLDFASLCIIDPMVVIGSSANDFCQIFTFTFDLESQVYTIIIGINNTVDLAKSNYESNAQLTVINANNLETTALDNLGDEAKIQDYSLEDDHFLLLRTRKSNALISITSLLKNGLTSCSHDTTEMISLAQQIVVKL